MSHINYSAFAFEAIKITIFCLVITGLFKLLGASNNTVLIVFNMAVMSSAATFSVEKKHFSHVVLGSSVMIVSIIAGGIIGYYTSGLAKLLTILYAGLAFYLPQSKDKSNIFVTSSVMFLVFTALPFSLQEGFQYALDGLVVVAVFIGFYCVFEYKRNNIHKENNQKQANIKQTYITQNQPNLITAAMAILSLTSAWMISNILSRHYHHLSHLYWIGLTALVIIQASQQKTILTAMKRILINAFGAIVIVLLFAYVMPPNFWINFSLLILFLFLIFFLGFSYMGRTLFIEMFVLGFTHLLGQHQNIIAWDRVILTLIGGTIVIIATPISYLLVTRLFHYSR